jgi:hypothetical protein
MIEKFFFVDFYGFFYGVTCFDNPSYENFIFIFSMFFFIFNSLTLDYFTFSFIILATFLFIL